jgi:hypothetical protein
LLKCSQYTCIHIHVHSLQFCCCQVLHHTEESGMRLLSFRHPAAGPPHRQPVSRLCRLLCRLMCRSTPPGAVPVERMVASRSVASRKRCTSALIRLSRRRRSRRWASRCLALHAVLASTAELPRWATGGGKERTGRVVPRRWRRPRVGGQERRVGRAWAGAG